MTDDDLSNAPSRTKESADTPGTPDEKRRRASHSGRTPRRRRGLPLWAWVVIGLLACAFVIGGVWAAYHSGPPAGQSQAGLSAETTGTGTSGPANAGTSGPLPQQSGEPTTSAGTTKTVPAQGQETTWTVVWNRTVKAAQDFIGWTSPKFQLKAGHVRMVMELSGGNGGGFLMYLVRIKPSGWQSVLWRTDSATDQAVTTDPISVKAGTYRITMQGTASFVVKLEQ